MPRGQDSNYELLWPSALRWSRASMKDQRIQHSYAQRAGWP